MKTILQTETSECGLACLAMVADHFGYKVELSELRRRFSVSLKGATLSQLTRHAGAIQLSSRALRLDVNELEALKLPAILHWDMSHFVVLARVRTKMSGRKIFTVIDPAFGERQYSEIEMSRFFTGVALELLPSPSFIKIEKPISFPIRFLTGNVFGLRRAIVQVIMLAIALEVFAIVAPLFNQFVVDEVIVSGDRELLQVLVVGFGLLIATQTCIGLARSWFLMRWSIDLGIQWGSRVFGHLIRLPVSYFEKRHVGDIVSRFGSLGAIQGTLTSLIVESLLDGFMAFFALIMMGMYSLRLTVVVVTGVLFYALLRWAFYAPLKEASQERLVLAAKESSNFLETIRAITPLKLFGRESERAARWQNLKLDVVNRDVKTQKLSIIFKISNTLISSGQTLAVFYLGAVMVMDNIMSIGMLFAFNSYAGTFAGRIFGLIDLSINVRMLQLHTDRLGDIVLTPEEEHVNFEVDLSRILPSITLKNVSFRYGEGDPWILKSVNLHIVAGESLALVGPSGCGKTTLCKLLLGILKPNEGEILIGDVPIDQIGLRAYRSMIGTVMQDDTLLAGSIEENISFFDSQIDKEHIEECAKLAFLHDEIVAMPMGYQSLVGDMGSSMSGGQKQRLLLARALYKRPRILALDEATSHLDVANEHRVNTALKKMQLTKIIVAHRPETISSADRIIRVTRLGLVEDTEIITSSVNSALIDPLAAA